ncbi:hypothetical protein PAXRUDRAFT_21593 [Paxillus rubicundulus Ve08.2h10]|uniref:Uncharacterized protein n=1 Tax=Paxillus rubicundulus Ve08.2h10 TaxID=930991 RepID=A0A0D0CPN1_9AGAM|nr:hypothetical protein PAXRUDRAFT_21593 [Paxillus rubicundulus Ve08.2h10]
MDVIKKFKNTIINRINFPSMCWLPVIHSESKADLDKKADVEKIEKKEFKYGQWYRHKLDVYYPPASSVTKTPSGKLPVLFFIYGGGYHTGSWQFQEVYKMGYQVLGTFFA